MSTDTAALFGPVFYRCEGQIVRSRFNTAISQPRSKFMQMHRKMGAPSCTCKYLWVRHRGT